MRGDQVRELGCDRADRLRRWLLYRVAPLLRPGTSTSAGESDSTVAVACPMLEGFDRDRSIFEVSVLFPRLIPSAPLRFTARL